LAGFSIFWSIISYVDVVCWIFLFIEENDVKRCAPSSALCRNQFVFVVKINKPVNILAVCRSVSTYKCLSRVYDWHHRGIQLPWDTCKANTIEESLSEWGLLTDGDLLSGEETSRDTEVNFDFIRCSKLKNKLRIIQFNGRARLCRPFNCRIWIYI
jgi:hypothetical protein